MGVTSFFHEEFAKDPLFDLGHSTLPDFWIGHYTLLTLVLFLWVIGILLFCTKEKDASFIFVRFFATMGVLLWMRSISIMVTIQPSPFGHLPPPPSSPWYWKLSYRNLFTTLGDNMFSAHTSFATTSYLCLICYPLRDHKFLKKLLFLPYGFIIFWIITSHLHYTADVVIALYLSVTVWFTLDYFYLKYTQEKFVG